MVLIDRLAQTGRSIVTIDIAPLEPALARKVRREFTGSITDKWILERCARGVRGGSRLSSRRAAVDPFRVHAVTAHEVNVEGTLRLLEFAQHEGESHGRPVIFLYPSSIAAYGLPNLDAKMRAGRVHEDEWNTPTTNVRVQQVVLRASRAVLREVLQTAGRRYTARPRRLPLPQVSRIDLCRHRSRRRDVRLRPRNDSRLRHVASTTHVSSGPTRVFRSWPCPMPSKAC
jgi:nucleoside-diphosphate-sugar epimerase